MSAGRRGAALVLLVAGLGGVAAGFVTGGSDDRPLDAALAGDLFARADGMLTESEAQCAAPRIVAGIGTDRLDEVEILRSPEAGMPVSELTDDEERVFAAESYACVEDAHLPLHLVEMAFPAGETTEDQRMCLAEGVAGHLGADRTREGLTQLFTKEALSIDDIVPDADQAAVDAVADGCFGSAG